MFSMSSSSQRTSQNRLMVKPLISQKTRYEFREYFVGCTLREIRDTFGNAGVRCDLEYDPETQGERRSLVEQYYHTVDWTDGKSVSRVVMVYETVLNDLFAPPPPSAWSSIHPAVEQNEQVAARLLHWLRFDGFERVGMKLIRTADEPGLDALQKSTQPLEGVHLTQQIQRMRDAVDTDPALAIGTAKELIETVCKTVLEERGKPVQGTPDIPTLTKALLKELRLVPEGVSDASRGADIIKGILRSLGTIGNDLGQLRGLYGTGHGQTAKSKTLQPRHAKLAVGAAATFVMFVFETHQEQSATHDGD